MQSLLLNDVAASRASVAASPQQCAIGATMLLVQLALTLLLSPQLTLVALAFLVARLGRLACAGPVAGWRAASRISEAMESSAGSGFRLHAGLKAALAQGTVPRVSRRISRRAWRRTPGGDSRISPNMLSLAQLGRRSPRRWSRPRAAVRRGAGARAAVPGADRQPRSCSRGWPAPRSRLQNSALAAGAYAPAFAAIERRLGEHCRPIRSCSRGAEPLRMAQARARERVVRASARPRPRGDLPAS